jgi:hypothetical protein
MAYERGPCREICKRDKKSCFHGITCKIVRQFKNGRWLIENRYGLVNSVDERNMIFETGEYQIHHNPTHRNPNAVSQYPTSSTTIEDRIDFTQWRMTKETEEDFNAKLIRLKRVADSTDSTINTHINISDLNGAAFAIDHWSDTDKSWHTKDCKIILR